MFMVELLPDLHDVGCDANGAASTCILPPVAETQMKKG
jgi:hypothetical protein